MKRVFLSLLLIGMLGCQPKKLENNTVVQKEVQFLRDVAPYFTPTLVLIFAHILYLYTGNLVLPVWLMYLVTPINGFISEGDNTNLS